jgi:hypothetical protein
VSADRAFPVELLVPTGGTLAGFDEDLEAAGDDFSIEIALEPFELEGEEVETSIRLDAIELDVEHARELEGRTFAFPTNPEEGYVDGSVYLGGAHNPVDVHEIRFGRLRGRTIDAAFRVTLDFEYEGVGFATTPHELAATLELVEAEETVAGDPTWRVVVPLTAAVDAAEHELSEAVYTWLYREDADGVLIAYGHTEADAREAKSELEAAVARLALDVTPQLERFDAATRAWVAVND